MTDPTDAQVEAELKKGAQIIWAQAGPVTDEAYWEEIWEYETRPERVSQTGEWWPITAAHQIAALAAARAGSTDEYEPDAKDWENSRAYGQGFAAGIEAAAKRAEDEEEPQGDCPVELPRTELREIVVGSVRATKKAIAAGIRALRSSAAPAESEDSK